MLTSFIRKLTRVMRREGVRGLVSRLRHTPLRMPHTRKAPPLLACGGIIVDHGDNAAILAKLREILPTGDWEADRPSVHLGAPPHRAGLGDIVVLTAPGPAPCTARSAGLIADCDPRRLSVWARAGRSTVAIGPVLSDPTALNRFEVMTGLRDPDLIDFGPKIAPVLGQAIPRLCVTLPEFPDRTRHFEAMNRWDIHLVPGIRLYPGWKGAGHTYRQIARGLRTHGLNRALIAQDDMLPGPNFDERLEIAEEYWLQSGADMLAGLITDVDETFVVRRVVKYRGVTFLHLNKSVGLVCNLFGARALDHVLQWQEGRISDGIPCTIDRHLAAAPDFEVITALPFLVGHRSEVASTMWSFNNARYDTLIAYSEKRLTEMAGAASHRI